MASLNKVMLIGNLGKDPEVRHLDGGVAVARFPIATSETWKDKNGQKQEKTEWHNITLWRGLAEVAEKWLSKGASVFIEGKIQTSSYQDKDGQTRYTTEIVGEKMTMLSSSQQSQANGGQRQQAAANGNGSYAGGNGGGFGSQDEPDDLPF